MTEINNSEFFENIKSVIIAAQQQYYRNTNSILLKMYWEIGRIIVEEQQEGKFKAAYGKKVLQDLSVQLTLAFGKGFDYTNLTNMRRFYQAFPILDALRQELSWTHYRILSRVENPQHRLHYVNEAIAGNWNTRTLQRNIDSLYVARLLELPTVEQQRNSPQQFIKDPYIFEFAGLVPSVPYSESDLETALISHIQHFLMELGKGFAFVARQQHIVTDTSDFFIDLVFYNYYLKCFVLIDLKTTKLTHEAIGQMDMYVRMYNDLKKSTDDNPTIGLILCTEKDETIVKYSVLAENEKMFASKYRLYLPDEDQLKQLIENDRIKFELDHE
jgi:predicted nuclease of restriction endonuclease-like (RecB) superfamily